MPEYIDPDVEALRDSDSEEEITLLLGVSGNRDEFVERVKRHGVTVEATLGQATVRVTAPKAAISALCDLDALKSIEIERDDVRILDQGNSQSRQRLTR